MHDIQCRRCAAAGTVSRIHGCYATENARRRWFDETSDLSRAYFDATHTVPDAVPATVYDGYMHADGITWDNVHDFQSDLVRSTTYRNEPRTLRPNEFYASGGGNCVDYSPATTAFLGYHGIESYIGGFFAPGEPVGHAVVLVPVEAVPAGYAYIDLEGWYTEDRQRVRDGRYVPIDYEHVGGFSNATAENAELTRVWEPQELSPR